MSLWTTPPTYVTGDPLPAAQMNLGISDNLNALKNPPSDSYLADEGTNYSTTSTSLVDVASGGELALTITTTGGDVIIGFQGSIQNSIVAAGTYLEVDIDGAPFAGDDGIMFFQAPVADYTVPVSFVVIKTGLSAAAHTFTLQWKVSSGVATIWSGDGTAAKDVHPQFWVREI